MNTIIADDHFLVTQGLSQLIKNHFDDVSIVEVHDKSSLFEKLNNKDFQLLLLDIRLGDTDARTFINEIKNKWKSLKIMAISSHSDQGTVQSTLNLGVDGYVIKNEPTQSIIEGIRKVLKGDKYISPELKELFIEQSLMGSDNEEISLTRREKEVLKEVLNEHSNKEIAEKLFISEKTVENHRSNLFVKFGVKNVAGLVKKAIIKGYME